MGAVADRTGKRDDAIETLADFGDEGEGVRGTGVPARARGDEDEPVDAGGNRLLGVTDVDDVVQHHAAVAVDLLDEVGHRPERGDDHRHAPRDADREILLGARVGLVDDQVDAEERLFAVGREGGRDLVQPLAKTFGAALVEGRERAEDAGARRRDDERRAGDQEHRRGNDRQAQAAEKGSGVRHRQRLRAWRTHPGMGRGGTEPACV